MERAVHALAHWCEALACSRFLPGIVHPFVQIFEREECLGVEACMTFLMNWAAPWFQLWPSPPLHTCVALRRSRHGQPLVRFSGLS